MSIGGYSDDEVGVGRKAVASSVSRRHRRSDSDVWNGANGLSEDFLYKANLASYRALVRWTAFSSDARQQCITVTVGPSLDLAVRDVVVPIVRIVASRWNPVQARSHVRDLVGVSADRSHRRLLVYFHIRGLYGFERRHASDRWAASWKGRVGK